MSVQSKIIPPIVISSDSVSTGDTDHTIWVTSSSPGHGSPPGLDGSPRLNGSPGLDSPPGSRIIWSPLHPGLPVMSATSSNAPLLSMAPAHGPGPDDILIENSRLRQQNDKLRSENTNLRGQVLGWTYVYYNLNTSANFIPVTRILTLSISWVKNSTIQRPTLRQWSIV